MNLIQFATQWRSGYHDPVFLLARVVTLVEILVAVGFVVLWKWFAFILAKFVNGA